jgi:hypothetical protein
MYPEPQAEGNRLLPRYLVDRSPVSPHIVAIRGSLWHFIFSDR